jgi:transposase-like protein
MPAFTFTDAQLQTLINAVDSYVHEFETENNDFPRERELLTILRGKSDPEPEPCPICNGDGVFMGGLGNLAHYRCRDCGGEFHQKAGAQ